jgi:hypothetical protein
MTNADHQAALTHAIAALNDANQAEAAAIAKRNTAANEIISIVARIRQDHDSPRDPAYLAVLRHLYWQHPAVSSTELASVSGFRSPQEMTAAIGPVPSGLSCSRCQSQIMRTSRSWKVPNSERWARNRPLLCPGCERDDRKDRSTKWRIDDLRRKHVEQAEVKAPREAWAVAVALVLEYPPIAVGRPDQHGPDQFWHVYELSQKLARRLAESPDVDVVVAAADATSIVKEAHRLVGWDLTRTWNAVTPITSESPTAVLGRLDGQIREVRERRSAEALDLYPDDYEPADGWTY